MLPRLSYGPNVSETACSSVSTACTQDLVVGIATTPATDAALGGVSGAVEHRVDLALAKVGVKVGGWV